MLRVKVMPTASAQAGTSAYLPPATAPENDARVVKATLGNSEAQGNLASFKSSLGASTCRRHVERWLNCGRRNSAASVRQPRRICSQSLLVHT